MTYDSSKYATATGAAPDPGCEPGKSGTPTERKLDDGQKANHWVLTEEERAKGFIRPVRYAYQHVGACPKYPLRDLTPEEHAQYDQYGYVKFEPYPESERPMTGRYWTNTQLKSGCGAVTRMGKSIAETYARDPKFYGSTFCCHCQGYYAVGEFGEFVWDGTGIRVGT